MWESMRSSKKKNKRNQQHSALEQKIHNRYVLKDQIWSALSKDEKTYDNTPTLLKYKDHCLVCLDSSLTALFYSHTAQNELPHHVNAICIKHFNEASVSVLLTVRQVNILEERGQGALQCICKWNIQHEYKNAFGRSAQVISDNWSKLVILNWIGIKMPQILICKYCDWLKCSETVEHFSQCSQFVHLVSIINQSHYIKYIFNHVSATWSVRTAVFLGCHNSKNTLSYMSVPVCACFIVIMIYNFLI